jgi:hypothetical protein
MKERLGALITELVVAAVRFGRCNTRRHCFERLLFAHCGRPSRRLRAATGASARLSFDPNAPPARFSDLKGPQSGWLGDLGMAAALPAQESPH